MEQLRGERWAGNREEGLGGCGEMSGLNDREER